MFAFCKKILSDGPVNISGILEKIPRMYMYIYNVLHNYIHTIARESAYYFTGLKFSEFCII